MPLTHTVNQGRDRQNKSVQIKRFHCGCLHTNNTLDDQITFALNSVDDYTIEPEKTIKLNATDV